MGQLKKGGNAFFTKKNTVFTPYTRPRNVEPANTKNDYSGIN